MKVCEVFPSTPPILRRNIPTPILDYFCHARTGKNENQEATSLLLASGLDSGLGDLASLVGLLNGLDDTNGN